MLSLSF